MVACKYFLFTESSLVVKMKSFDFVVTLVRCLDLTIVFVLLIDLLALYLSGTYCHKTVTRLSQDCYKTPYLCYSSTTNYIFL